MENEFLVKVRVARNLVFKVYADTPDDAYRTINNAGDVRLSIGAFEPLYDEEMTDGVTLDYVRKYADDDGALILRYPYKEIVDIKEVHTVLPSEETKLPF